MIVACAPIQSIMTISSSVYAGHAAHEKPLQPSASLMRPASTDGKQLPAGKYAWKRGCCQCVIPGISTRSTSRSTSAKSSPRRGAVSGSSGRRYPGCTSGITRRCSTLDT